MARSRRNPAPPISTGLPAAPTWRATSLATPAAIISRRTVRAPGKPRRVIWRPWDDPQDLAASADQYRKVTARRHQGMHACRLPGAVRLHGAARIAGAECDD